MGYFNRLEQDVMSMAHDMGSTSSRTILVISRALDVSPEEVQRVLEGDRDCDPGDWYNFDPSNGDE